MIKLDNTIIEILADINFVVCFLVLKELTHLLTELYGTLPCFLPFVQRGTTLGISYLLPKEKALTKRGYTHNGRTSFSSLL